MKRICVFGGSFNPPGEHHAEILGRLLDNFDEVYIWPCGSDRPDKRTVADIEPIHRATMLDLAFYGKAAEQTHPHRPSIEFFDLEYGVFTRTGELDEVMKAKHPGAEIWHYVGGDWVIGGAKGEAGIQKEWRDGRRLWNELKFVVGTRVGYPFDQNDLPPHSELIPLKHPGTSSDIRDLVFHGKPFEDRVNQKVAAYIKRYNLYRGGLPGNSAVFQTEKPSIWIAIDEYRKAELESYVLEKFGDFAGRYGKTDIIIPIGGDGTMLKAIVDTWRWRQPYFGLNRGHVGYLMNDVRSNFNPRRLLSRKMEIAHCPLLHVEVEQEDGRVTTAYAFNDARVERVNGNPVWVKVEIEDKVWIERLVGDGVLAATPAGSTGYAHSMGAATLPFTIDKWLLVGSNVATVEPGSGVKEASLPKLMENGKVVTLTNADDSGNGRRPLRAFVDGREFTNVVNMRVWLSRVAAAELLFLPGQHLEAKRFGMRRKR